MIRVTKEQGQLTTEQVNNYMDILKTSEDKETKDDAAMQLYYSIYRYIIDLLAHKFGTYYAANPYDLISVCNVCFFEKIAGYDYTKGKLITYLKPHLLHAITEYINGTNNKTSYYGQQIRKIKRCIKEFEDAGEDWNDIKICEKTGIALHTVKECLKQNDAAEVHISSSDFLEENISDFQISPEDKLISSAETESIHKALSTLTKDEEKVIRMHYGFGFDFPLSIPKIAVATGLRVDQVKRIKNEGMRKITQNIQREGLFQDRAIKKEIDVISEEITFLPNNTEILMRLANEPSLSIDF